MSSRSERVPFVSSIVTGTLRGFAGLFGSAPRDREWQETARLAERVKTAFATSPIGQTDPEEVCDTMAFSALDNSGRAPEGPVYAAVRRAAAELVRVDGIFARPASVPSRDLPLDEGIRLRETLRTRISVLRQGERALDLWFRATDGIFSGVLAALPPGALPQSGNGDAPTFGVALVDLLEDPAEVIECILGTFDTEELSAAGLFEGIRYHLTLNLLRASGIDPAEAHTTRRSVVMPSEAQGKTPGELVDSYLGGTPFAGFLQTPMAFELPLSARFEHMHVVAGSGHGKTQLLQLLIHRDLQKAREEKGALVVIDSQGDMLSAIAHLELFRPRAAETLAEKLVIIDPNDVAHPPCLNLFDFGLERLERYSAAEREKLLNGAISLYEYLFGALLGAELTQRQGVIFRYLARLLMAVPGATVHTLREFMEDPEAVRPHILRLDGTTRLFFETQFPDAIYNDTRRQILTRLWGVLSNPVLERMFSHEKNKVDLFDAMQSGKIVLINTAKDLLKREGCQILGRFFIAQIAQATFERATTPADRRRACFVYIDEAYDYFDEHVGDLLNQARKYKVGMILAHQNLDQLDTRLRADVMSSTSIKLAGGVSAKDARALAADMRCEPEFIQATRKRRDRTEFACFVKNVTGGALKVSVPFGVLEAEPKMGEADFEHLLDLNRARYAAGERESPRSARSGARSATGFELGEHEVL